MAVYNPTVGFDQGPATSKSKTLRLDSGGTKQNRRTILAVLSQLFEFSVRASSKVRDCVSLGAGVLKESIRFGTAHDTLLRFGSRFIRQRKGAVVFCSVLFCPVLFCSVMCRSVLFCSVLFCTALLCSVLYCSVLFCSVHFGSVRFGSVRCCGTGPDRPDRPDGTD